MKRYIFLFLCFITYYIGAIPPKFWEQIQLINLTPNSIEYYLDEVSTGYIDSGKSLMLDKQQLSYDSNEKSFNSHELRLMHIIQSTSDKIRTRSIFFSNERRLFFDYHYDIFMDQINHVRDFKIDNHLSSRNPSNIMHTDMYTVLIDYSFLSPLPPLCNLPNLIDLNRMLGGPPESRVAFFNKHVNNRRDNIIRIRIIIMPRVIIPNLDESGSRICRLYNCFFKFDVYITKLFN